MIRTRSIIFVLLMILALLVTACGAFSNAGADAQPIVQAVQNQVAAQVQPSPPVKTNTQVPVTQAPTAVQPGQLFPHEQMFIELYKQVSPSVVHIAVDSGQGSGFVYDADGYIVTNNHVVAGAQTIVVTFPDGDSYDANVVGTDVGSDLAVIKIDVQPGDIQALPLADSDNLQVGQLVLAIGSPFGLANTLTTGIISGLDRLFPGAQSPDGGSYNIPDIIQTDAAINPGNSGGPLLDTSGRVIGVNSAIESPVRASSGVGFAVPSNVVAIVIPQLMNGGKASTPWLGVSGTELNAALAETLNLDRDQRGIVLASVIAGGPAEIAGVHAGDPATGLGGDVIVGIDNHEVRAFDDLLGYIVGKTKVGQTVELQILRDGELITIPVTLAERPSVE